MTRNLRLVCLSAMLCTATAFTQVATAQGSNNSDVAYVYVASTAPNSNTAEIQGYAAAANGALTHIAGSPFSANVNSMAVNGKYLFGSNNNGVDIDAYTIEANGALTWSSQSDVIQGENCDTPGSLFLDHTGQALYNVDIYGNDCANSTWQAFSVGSKTGALTFRDYAGASPEYAAPLRFIANNQFAYGASCYHFYPAIFGVQRGSNGSLTMLNLEAPYPASPEGEGWCPASTAADPANHLAIAMALEPAYGEVETYQLASYTVGGSGNLMTNNTSANMPAVQVGTVSDLSMAPSGTLLAVSGAKGLQVFHFNGANPVTPYTGLLTSVEVDQIFWDNSHHLYAISRSAGKLWVFTVTATTHSEAPDSPYAVSDPGALIVQPLP
ncbi:MAG TPA: hypothetical protein VME68_08440 [Acidobacteriaceae bacterium]|nr:hypothetical protein [Acidobacteriaceae bacterium]